MSPNKFGDACSGALSREADLGPLPAEIGGLEPVFDVAAHQMFYYCSRLHYLEREICGMIEGSCCCGAIKFQLASEPSVMGTCHCSRCRKVGASAIVFVKKEDLTWVTGNDQVALYKPASPYRYGRCFCKICGASLGEILSEEDSFPIAANALDTEVGLKNQFHEFVSEKPAWYEICDDAPQSDEHPS